MATPTPERPTANTVPAGSSPATSAAVNAALADLTDDAAPEDGSDD